MKSIYFYHPATADQRILHLAESMEIVEQNSHWVDGTTPLFSLLEEKNPTIVFLNGTENPEHVRYAKKDFPATKFVVITDKAGVEYDAYDKVIHLSDKNTQGMYLDYLVNQWHCDGTMNEVYQSDVLLITDGHDVSNTYITRMIDSLGNKYKVKAYGNNRLPSLYYLGSVNRLEYKNLIASTKVVLMFNEEWFNTAISNGKAPLMWNNGNKLWVGLGEFEFANYEQLESVCGNLLEKNVEKATFETYTDFCVKLIEELYK